MMLVEALRQSPAVFITIAVLFGLMVGSLC
jgi:hypothetical protein